jgi:hypothetical protein
LVRNAFREGTKWSFYSLLPWCTLAAVLCLPLSKIKDMDAIFGKKKKALEAERKDGEKDGEVAVVENGGGEIDAVQSDPVRGRLSN